MQVQTYGNQGMQGGTGIPQKREDMPGKSLHDLFPLKAKPVPCVTLACDFWFKTHEIQAKENSAKGPKTPGILLQTRRWRQMNKRHRNWSCQISLKNPDITKNDTMQKKDEKGKAKNRK